MKKILAVSGGVDSMVMLDLFVKNHPNEVIVAHFNHGTRETADLDEEFVKKCCQKYGVLCISKKEYLGEEVSEGVARERRYNFLYHVANKYHGRVQTAHHEDDLIESIVINFIRGTGWRGLTPLNNERVDRPLVRWGFSKRDVLEYAAKHKISFRQDPTNNYNNYLRNRVRRAILASVEKNAREQLLDLYKKQLVLGREIDLLSSELAEELTLKHPFDELFIGENAPEDTGLARKKNIKNEIMRFDRKCFLECDDKSALEILKKMMEKNKILMTRPQLQNFLLAIRTYENKKKFNLPKDRMATIHKEFISV